MPSRNRLVGSGTGAPVPPCSKCRIGPPCKDRLQWMSKEDQLELRLWRRIQGRGQLGWKGHCY
jgi:hypothetical protein